MLNAGQVSTFYGRQYGSHTHTLDGLNTFHGMGMIKAVTPGIKCTSRVILCVEVTAECVQQLPKLVFTFTRMLKGSISNIKKKLPEISKHDNSRNTDTLWRTSYLLYPTAQAWTGTLQLVHHGKRAIRAQTRDDCGRYI